MVHQPAPASRRRGLVFLRCAVAPTGEVFGGPDVLVNNPGMFAVNIRGVFLVTPVAAKQMRAGGRIITSAAAAAPQAYPGMLPFSPYFHSPSRLEDHGLSDEKNVGVVRAALCYDVRL
jgi:hypothetical protein